MITADESVVRFDVLVTLALHSEQSGLSRIHVGAMPTFLLSLVDRLCGNVRTFDFDIALPSGAVAPLHRGFLLFGSCRTHTTLTVHNLDSCAVYIRVFFRLWLPVGGFS